MKYPQFTGIAHAFIGQRNQYEIVDTALAYVEQNGVTAAISAFLLL